MAWKPDYVTDEELKEYIRRTDSVDDSQVARAIAAASRAVDRACKRQFGSAAQSRIYTAALDPVLLRNVVVTDDISTDSGVMVSVDTDADGGFVDTLTDYSLRPVNAEEDGLPFTAIAVGKSSTVSMPLSNDGVRVTAIFGWTAVPEAVKQATLIQASRLLARRNSPYGIAGSPDAGSEMRLLAKLDPDVEVSLAAYKRRTDKGFA